ncbi:ABC transporter substrate-binding protein [Sinorhizobium sp. 7-81]|uniref:ABC transporter substrate-binding protein n=1 Tax=Sinorhizobium sp. 8-89 TaxID=3049089 RepID=UPI0024C30B4B|nr:ABC transporter substrate-binding protein [Sinorhizobium sp. 8-89]MDK1492605.1 ABC transporter substrate-binding protein [Sinorhizobium sp. 8-89]
MDRTVAPDGIDLVYLNMPVEETFFRMLRHREFDIAEMSLSSYVMSCFAETRPFVAIPVFPSRYFRHSSIYVNAAAGIREPKDLIGKRVGTPEYQMTAPVWIRGILSDEYGVKVDDVTYYAGGEEQPNRPEKLPLDLPSHIRVNRIGPTQTLSARLRDGEIDALYTARKPSSYEESAGRVRRLFENFVEIERSYFKRTGIFPIMHTIVIRREVYEAHRWIAQSLYKAFAEAQSRVYRELEETAALKVMLPWLNAHVEEARRLMGDDYWSYGFKQNRETLETFLRYSYEQGLSKRKLCAEEIFAPETMESFVI